jgi:hypothetical protein
MVVASTFDGETERNERIVQAGYVRAKSAIQMEEKKLKNQQIW